MKPGQLEGITPMKTDNALTKLQIYLMYDGDIELEKGGTQKFLEVEVHSPQEMNQAGSNPTIKISQRLISHKRKMVGMAGFVGAPLACSGAEPATDGSL